MRKMRKNIYIKKLWHLYLAKKGGEAEICRDFFAIFILLEDAWLKLFRFIRFFPTYIR